MCVCVCVRMHACLQVCVCACSPLDPDLKSWGKNCRKYDQAKDVTFEFIHEAVVNSVRL